MVAIAVVQGIEVPGSQKGAQSLEEFVELLQSITQLGKQITGMQRPADLPPPGQSLPPEMELEPEVAFPCKSSTHSCHAASLAFLSSDWSHPWGTELLPVAQSIEAVWHCLQRTALSSGKVGAAGQADVMMSHSSDCSSQSEDAPFFPAPQDVLPRGSTHCTSPSDVAGPHHSEVGAPPPPCTHNV